MKKYEYKLESYTFNLKKHLISDMKKAFDKEGSEGWELVQWEVCLEQLNITSLYQNTKSITHILATWKRELHE